MSLLIDILVVDSSFARSCYIENRAKKLITYAQAFRGAKLNKWVIVHTFVDHGR